MRYIRLLILTIFLGSCTPQFSLIKTPEEKSRKEIREEKKCSKKASKLAKKCPSMVKDVKIKTEAEFIKPKTEFQIVYVDKPTLPDAFIWRQGDAQLTRTQRGDTTFYEVICDTLTITSEVEVPVRTLQPPPERIKLPLSFIERFFLYSGVALWVFIILRILILPRIKI